MKAQYKKYGSGWKFVWFFSACDIVILGSDPWLTCLLARQLWIFSSFRIVLPFERLFFCGSSCRDVFFCFFPFYLCIMLYNAWRMNFIKLFNYTNLNINIKQNKTKTTGRERERAIRERSSERAKDWTYRNGLCVGPPSNAVVIV